MKTLIIITLLVFATIISGCDKTQDSTNYDSFAKCLTEKNITMYGIESCSHCQNQKKAFGNSFQYINYIDCGGNRQICTDEQITSVPVWSIEHTKYTGEKSFEELSRLSGCPLPQNE